MRKTFFTALFLFLLGSALSAQNYLDEYSIQDSTMKPDIVKKMKVFKLFQEGRLDSLYSALGNDSTVINRDTLTKYYRLYSEIYTYTDDVSNPVTWSTSSVGNTLNRTFVGNSIGTIKGSDVNQAGLEMHVEVKVEKGVIRISRITFAEVSVSPEVRKHVIDARNARTKEKVKEKIQEEQKKSDQRTKEQIQKGLPPR